MASWLERLNYALNPAYWVPTPAACSRSVLEKYADPRDGSFLSTLLADGLPDEAEESGLWDRLDGKARVLLVGCGGGCEALALAKRGLRVSVLEISEVMIEQARRAAAERGLEIDFTRGDVAEFDRRETDVDLVWMGDSVYIFIPTAARRLQALRRLRACLKPGGLLVMDRSFNLLPSGLSWYSPSLWVDRWRMLRRTLVPAWEFPEPGDRMIPMVTPTSDPGKPCFAHFFSNAQEIRDDLRKTGFEPLFEKGRFWLWQNRPEP